jgi:hypothetical protein
MINPLKISEMLSQASHMQEEVQRKLEMTVVEGSSGGGAVTASLNGKKQLLRIKIDPSAVAGLKRDAKPRTPFSRACRECWAASSCRAWSRLAHDGSGATVRRGSGAHAIKKAGGVWCHGTRNPWRGSLRN